MNKYSNNHPRANDAPTPLELCPDINAFVLKQWANRFDNFGAFERKLNWMCLQIIKNPIEHKDNPALLEDIAFVLGFGTRQMIDDYLFEPEAA